MIRITDIKMNLNAGGDELKKKIVKKLRVSEKEIGSVKVIKKAVDARNKSNIHHVYSVEVAVNGNEGRVVSRCKDNKITLCEKYKYQIPLGNKPRQRPVVVGFGPAGMFAALILAQAGYRPIVLERGQRVEDREKTVRNFWSTGVLLENSNVQFGEGGAGTFSDGKLNTGTGDIRIAKVLSELAEAGAPEEILYEGKPHIGTDRLPDTVKNIRKKIISLGAEIRFESLVKDFKIVDGQVKGITVKTGAGHTEDITCSQVIMAIGHSARDTFVMLASKKLHIIPKSFSIGARIEHSTDMINSAQYGESAGLLPAADYKLSCRLKSGRGVYTFCMCPGGQVVGAASEFGAVVTNGMSTYARDDKNSNSALLVGISPADFGDSPLAGIKLQRQIERQAFNLAGKNYFAPAQRVEDFLNYRKSSCFGDIHPTYMPGVVPMDVSDCLPEFIAQAMREGIVSLGKRLEGFDYPDAIITAPETRSSSPIKIVRGDDLQSVSVRGLYPCGEGAGYAGGIISAAVDGIKCAEMLILS